MSLYACPKIALAIVADKRIILLRGHTDRPRAVRTAVWIAVTFVGPLLHADRHPPG
jgi:hypothetical protein